MSNANILEKKLTTSATCALSCGKLLSWKIPSRIGKTVTTSSQFSSKA